MDNLVEHQIIVWSDEDISDLDIEFSNDENDIQVNNLDYSSVDWNVGLNACLDSVYYRGVVGSDKGEKRNILFFKLLRYLLLRHTPFKIDNRPFPPK